MVSIPSIILAVVAACAVAFIAGARHGAAKIEARVVREKAEAGREAQRFERHAQRLQQESTDALVAKLTRIHADADRLRRELRNRPARPAQPDAAATSANCTGAGLHREDAEFLAGEAARAAADRAALDTCESREWDRFNAQQQQLRGH